MKKIISIVLVIAAVLTVFCACGKKESDPIDSGDYTYVIFEDGTAKITKYNGTEKITTLDIPDAFDEHTVTVIGEEAFAGVQTITVVNFPKTLLKIEENAFAGSSIKKAFMHRSSSMTEIGAYAFAECKNLVQADMPRSLETLGEKAYYYCDKLKIANFRGDTANIDTFAFDACPAVKIHTKSENKNVINFATVYGIETVIPEA